MRRSGRRAGQAAGAAALVGALYALAPHIAAADQPVKSAADCRAISDFSLRGQCWDSLDQQNQKDVQAVKKRDFGLSLAPQADAAVKPVAEAKPKKERVAKAKAPKPVNTEVTSRTLTLASVDTSRMGHVLMTATDGAVWEQTDGDDILRPPAVGDTMQVSKGMFGGYLCQVTRWQAVRCQRDK
jgi:hypothetical protein